MVGTSVRDRMKDAIMAKMMASAMGMNSQPATPLRPNSGSQTMQMHVVATKVGMTIWLAASMIAGSSALPISRCASMFSIITVASSTRMPTASARPPSVMTLIVCPAQFSPMIAHRMASGMEVAMMTVGRHDPKNSSTTMPVRAAAVSISRTTSKMESLTNTDASPRMLTFTSGGSSFWMRGSSALAPATTSSVEASPLFITTISTPCCPFTSTRLVCGWPPR